MKKKKWLGYILTGCAIIVICGIYLFPSDEIKRYISLHFSEAMPGYYMAIKKVKPAAFPPGLKLQQIDIYDQQGVLFTADHVFLRPRLLSVFTDMPGFAFNGSIFQGSINGDLVIKRMAAGSTLSFDSRIQNFLLSDILRDLDTNGYQIEGLLEGDLAGTLNSKSGADLSASVSVKQGTVDMSSSVLGLHRIEFSRLTSDLEMSNQLLTIKRCEIDSHQAQTTFKGKITFLNPLGESRLRLKGVLRIVGSGSQSAVTTHSGGGAITGKMSYRISGSFNDPVFALQ